MLGVDAWVVRQRIHFLADQSIRKPFAFSVDIVDACNLKCVQCPRGVYFKKNTSTRMRLDVFERLLDKMVAECDCQKIELFNWSEPFLHPELSKFVSLTLDKNIMCILSTNLSFSDASILESVLPYPLGMIVSVSGFDQEMQERYHKGSNVEYVKRNLQFIARAKQISNLPVYVEMHFLQFRDNQKDQILWEKFCNELGVAFCATPGYATEVTTPETARRLIHQPGFYKDADGKLKIWQNLSTAPILKSCPQHNGVPIDVRGDVYLCRAYWNRDEYRIGNYLNMTLQDIQLKRLQHKDCAYCLLRESICQPL